MHDLGGGVGGDGSWPGGDGKGSGCHIWYKLVFVYLHTISD